MFWDAAAATAAEAEDKDGHRLHPDLAEKFLSVLKTLNNYLHNSGGGITL
jgi:hypothetical protein